MDNLIITAIIGFISTLVGFFVGNRKRQADTDKIVLANVKDILEIYTTTIDDLKLEVKELKNKINEYEVMVEKMSSELTSLRKQLQKQNA